MKKKWGLLCVALGIFLPLVACASGEKQGETETESITVSTETTLQQDVMVMEPIGYVDNDGDTPAVLDILSSLPEQKFTSAQKYEDLDWQALEKSGDEVVVILAEEEQNGVTVYGYKGGAYGARGMAVRYDGAYSYFDYAWDVKQWHGELAVKDFNADGKPEIYFIFQGAIGTGVNADRLVVFEPDGENGGLNAHEFHAGGKLGEILSFTVSEDDRLIVSQNGIEKKSIDLNDDRDGVYAGEIYAVDDTSQISYSVADDGILMATNVGVWFEKGGPGVFLPDDAGKMEFEVTYTDGEFEVQ